MPGPHYVNIDDILADPDRNPNFEWAETINTIIDSKIRIYTDGKFKVVNPVLTYYREPVPIKIVGCVDPNTGQEATTEQICEFNDSVVELLIDETVAILAGDIEAFNQLSRSVQNIQRNS